MYDFDSFKKEVKPQGGIPSSTPKKKGEYDFDSFTNEVSKKKEPTSLDFWNAGLPSKDGSQVEAHTKSQVTSGAEEESKPLAQDINAIRETVTGETSEQRQLRQQKELKNKAAKILPSKKTVEEEAISRLQHPAIQQQIEQSKRMIGISDLNNDPIGNLISKNEAEKKQIKDAGGNSLESIKEIAVRDRQVELVKNGYFSDGYDAEEYLKSHPPNPNSETYKIASLKAQDKHKIDDAINTTTDFGKAANKLYSGEENEMQGDISNSKEGDNVYKLLQDPNIIAKAQHDPEFRTKYKEAQFNFYNHYPAKAKEIVNTKIAQKLEDDNHTGWFFNNPGKEKVDKVFDEMVKTGEINTQEKHIYDNEREDLGTLKSLLMGSPIPTADVVNSYSKNLVEGGKGILSSARDISNKATGGFFKRIGLLESDEDRAKRLQEQQYSTPTVEGKGAHGVLSGMSGFLGFATPMILGGMAGSPAAATAVMQFEGPNADYARGNIKGEGAQTAYTIAATGIDAFLMKLLPTKQAGEAISGLFKKELAGTITDLADHKITQAAAQDLWANKLKNYASSVVKHNTQTAAVVDAFELAHNGLKAAFGSRDFNLENEAKEAIKNYPSLWLNSTFLSGLSALSSSAKSLNGGTIRRLANDPDGAKLQIEEMAKKHPELEQFKEQSLENLDHAIKINDELKQRPNLSETQKDKFMMLSLKDKILNEKASGIPDKTLKGETEKELASNEIEKERILNPDMGNKKFIEEMYDNELLPKGDMRLLENAETKKFDENKVGAYLKFVAQQANNLDENWQPNKTKATEAHFPEQVVEAANERWSKEIEAAKPKEEITPQETTTETVPKEKQVVEINDWDLPADELSRNAAYIPIKAAMLNGDIVAIGKDGEEMGIKSPSHTLTKTHVYQYNPDIDYFKAKTDKGRQILSQLNAEHVARETSKNEPQKSATEKPTIEEPPSIPPKTTVPVSEGEGETVGGITHAAVEASRKQAGLPEYEGHDVVTHEQRMEKARADIAANPNIHNEIMDKVEKGGKITPQDNAVLAIYKAGLDHELENNPSKETFDKVLRVAKVLDPEGTYAGQLLESRKLFTPSEDNLSNFLLEKQASQGASLSDAQVKSETAKYQELKEAKEKLEQQLEKEREQHAKDIAELGLNKAKAKARKEGKKTDEEYKAERTAYKEAAREALKKLRTETTHGIIIPGANELTVIAPHIKNYLKSLADQGIDKLDTVIGQIHAEFKDVLEGLTKRNVLDILAGDFDTKKEQTRNEKSNSLRLVKREAQLIKELELARKGEAKAKTESEKTPKTRRIEELEDKIKEVRRLNKGNAEAKVPTEKEALDAYIEKLTKKAERLSNDIKNKKYLQETEKPTVFEKSRKAHILEDRVIDLENKIRHERSKDEYSKRSKTRKVFDKVMEVLGIRRLVQSAVDISVPFRQGATLISPTKIDVWLKAFHANLKSVFSPTKFERVMYQIRRDPQYHDMLKDKVVFNDLGSADPNLHNEDFRKSFIYDIPIVSEPLKASNRSADAFLNVARYEMYKKMSAQLERKGLTRESDPKDFQWMGNWVMSMTGRGKMLDMLENSSAHTVLGNTFYGARLMASRFNLLNPLTYFDPRVSRQAKVEAMKDMAAFTATTMIAGLGLAAAGGKISLNPDDSDFLQVRFGNKVYDISGGLANYVRTFLRMTKAAYTKIEGTKYEGNKATDKAGTSALNFFRNKLAPNTSYGIDAFFGKAYGDKFKPSDIYAIYPMYSDDVVKAWKEEGPVSLATVLIPNLVGIGYGSYASKGQIDATLDDLLKRNMRSDEMNNEKIINYNEGGRPITDEEFYKFADKRDAELEKGIKNLYEHGADVINNNDEVVHVPYKKMTPEQVVKETNALKSAATKKIKEQLFGGSEKSEERRAAEQELRELKQEQKEQ